MEELLLHEMHIEDGHIDMSLSGEPANLFMSTLIQFFEQNGGKNFLTLTITNNGNKYAIDITNCNGKDTPAERLRNLTEENDRLKNIMRENLEPLYVGGE